MHIPVLQKEVIQYLDPKSNENFIDCTVGGAGHALAILEKTGPEGRILGIDRDARMIENCRLKTENFKKRAVLVCGNFAALKEIVKKEKFQPVCGILFDLGMSSWHLEESGRGFSFLKNEPLDMRYGDSGKKEMGSEKLTAEDIINKETQAEIERILRDYGEERFFKRIAEKIIEFRKIRPIKSTFQLAEIIKEAVPFRLRHKKIHFATKTFQALRIAVNDELNNLKKALSQTEEVLPAGGRLIIISFHSLEDRIVKIFFKEKARENIFKILTEKPIRPAVQEIKINPRSRSGRLRAAVKI